MKWVLAAILGSATGVLCVLAVLIFRPELLRQFPDAGAHSATAGSSITPTVAGFTNEVPVTTHCGYSGNTDFSVEAVFIDQGNIETPVQLSDEAKTSQVDIDVTREDQPIFLVLDGYWPTLWRVRVAPKVRIAGVLVSGYYPQALVGLPKDTFAIMSNLQERQCDWSYLSYSKREGRKPTDDALYKVIGRHSDNFLYRGSVKGPVVIGPSDKADQLPDIPDPVIPAGIKVDQSHRLYGKEVLDDLIGRQLLRRAKPKDVIAWLRNAKNITPNHQDTVKAMLMVSPDLDLDVFVAQSAVEIPASIPSHTTIIVPEGIAIPTGRLDKVEIWRMSPHSCLGIACDDME